MKNSINPFVCLARFSYKCLLILLSKIILLCSYIKFADCVQLINRIIKKNLRNNYRRKRAKTRNFHRHFLVGEQLSAQFKIKNLSLHNLSAHGRRHRQKRRFIITDERRKSRTNISAARGSPKFLLDSAATHAERIYKKRRPLPQIGEKQKDKGKNSLGCIFQGRNKLRRRNPITSSAAKSFWSASGRGAALTPSVLT